MPPRPAWPLCPRHGHTEPWATTPKRAACETALELHHQHQDREGEAHTLDSLGYIAHHTGRLPEALDYYRHPLALYHDLGHTYSEADTLGRLAHAQLANGQPGPACPTWQQALKLYQARHRTDQADDVQRQLDRQLGDRSGCAGS